MNRPVRWGIVGTGSIAGLFAEDLPHTDGVLAAVASRSQQRAQAFADTYGAQRAHGSYEALLDDGEVDVVYIATPHRQHHVIALAAIAAGKHLLVEKAFTCTLAGAREVVAAARRAGVFCMEAMWTRFQPAVVALREELARGTIGELRSVRVDLGLVRPYDPDHRLWDPAQGGGALLDLGVYPVSFVDMVMGHLGRTTVVGATGPGGVDTEATILYDAGDGRSALAQCSLLAPLPGEATIVGTGGLLRVEPRFHHPSRFHVQPLDAGGRAGDPRTVEAPATGRGYAHEIDEVHRCLAEGRTESATMPLAATLAVMSVLESALHTLGVYQDEATTV